MRKHAPCVSGRHRIPWWNNELKKLKTKAWSKHREARKAFKNWFDVVSENHVKTSATIWKALMSPLG